MEYSDEKNLPEEELLEVSSWLEKKVELLLDLTHGSSATFRLRIRISFLKNAYHSVSFY